MNIQVFSLLTVGIVVSYISNIIRMAILVLLGHYFGMSVLQTAHETIGWVIFTIWMLAFWPFVTFVMDRTSGENS